jgi:hypothetical protein
MSSSVSLMKKLLLFELMTLFDYQISDIMHLFQLCTVYTASTLSGFTWTEIIMLEQAIFIKRADLDFLQTLEERICVSRSKQICRIDICYLTSIQLTVLIRFVK